MRYHQYFNPVSALLFLVGAFVASYFTGNFDGGDVVAAVLFGFLSGAWDKIDRLRIIAGYKEEVQ